MIESGHQGRMVLFMQLQIYLQSSWDIQNYENWTYKQFLESASYYIFLNKICRTRF